jgi:hypothetical protein
MLNLKQLKDRMTILFQMEKYLSGLVPNSQEESVYRVIHHSLEREILDQCILQKLDFNKLKSEQQKETYGL